MREELRDDCCDCEVVPKDGSFFVFVFKNIYLLILFLAVSVLSCGMQFLSLWHSDFSLVVGHRLQSTQAL